MREAFAGLSSLVMLSAPPPGSLAQHDVPVGYIDHDVSIHCNHAASGGMSYPGDQAKLGTHTKFETTMLLLPYSSRDLDPGTRAMKWETVEKTTQAGFPEESTTIPVTLLYGYTVSPTPPTKDTPTP